MKKTIILVTSIFFYFNYISLTFAQWQQINGLFKRNINALAARDLIWLHLTLVVFPSSCKFRFKLECNKLWTNWYGCKCSLLDIMFMLFMMNTMMRLYAQQEITDIN